MSGSHVIEWRLMAGPTEVRVGDVVSAAAGGLPIYRVAALAGAEAWLEDERHMTPILKPLSGFTWCGRSAGS